MSAASYLLACALVVTPLAALTYGAWAVRAWLAPQWTGAIARLAEVTIAIAIAVVVSEVLGVLHLFNRAAVFVGVVAAGVTLGELGRRHRSRVRDDAPADRAPRSRIEELVAATIAVALVGAQWMSEVGNSYRVGMAHPDTVWYHGPYAAQFVQRGRLIFQLDHLDPLHAYAGQTSELLHAVFMLMTGRDVLSPLISVAWAGLALLAAWCIGQRAQVGALCVLGAAVVLGLPMITATHPGQDSNDIAAGALLISAIALLLASDFAPAPMAIAALAAGLALSTKVTVLAPVTVLTVGVVALAVRKRVVRVAWWWLGALALTGSFWFLRNAVVAHNPLPYYGFHLGPIRLHSQIRRGDAFSKFLFDGARWRGFFIPGFRRALGLLWWLVLSLAFAGTAFVGVRGRRGVERIAGWAVLAGLVAYVFTPYTADVGGLAFAFNVRYLAPSLLAAIVLVPLVVAMLDIWWRRALLVAFGAIVIVSATAKHYERVPAWPSGGRLWAIVGVLAILLAVLLRRRLRITAIVIAVVVVLAGWPVQRFYLGHRYVGTHIPLDRVDAALRRVHDARIGSFGVVEVYPFYGAALTNRVEQPAAPSATSPGEECKAWLDPLRARRYTYIVVANSFGGTPGPDEGWIAGDRSVSKITGDKNGRLYRVNAPLAENRCTE